MIERNKAKLPDFFAPFAALVVELSVLSSIFQALKTSLKKKGGAATAVFTR
jgi:p-aminobenzoyl-glutamate transporter AbgT